MNASKTINLEGYLPYRFPTSDEKIEPPHEAEKDVLFNPGEEQMVTIAYVTHPNDFYVIREQDKMAMTKLNDDISILSSFGQTGYHPIRNQSEVAILQVAAGEWVRVKVLEIFEEGKNLFCKVRKIDYGELVKVSAKFLKAAPSWVLERPQYAYHCSLGIQPLEVISEGELQVAGVWSPLVSDALKDLCKYETAVELNTFTGLKARCVFLQDEDTSCIDLVITPKNTSWPLSLVNGHMADWTPEYRAHTSMS